MFNKRASQVSKAPTLISLFAGAGGLDIGLERAGFRTLAVNELVPHACESLLHNKELSRLTSREFEPWFATQMEQRERHRHAPEFAARLRSRLRSGVGRKPILAHAQVLQKDIRELSAAELLEATGLAKGQLALLAGGPPCQPFSRAGKRETVEVSDGRLFLDFVRLVRELAPRWFLFENVKGLSQSKTSVVSGACSKCQNEFIVPFERRGELIDAKSASLTCPSCGETGPTSISSRDCRGGSLEIILSEFESLGYRCSSKLLNAADYGVPQNRERLFIVGSRDGEGFRWPARTHGNLESSEAPRTQLSLGIESTIKRWVVVKDVLWREGHPDFGELDYARAVLWVKNVVRPHDEPVTWTLDRPSPTIGAHQAAKLALAPKGVPEAQLLRQQWHTLGRRQGDKPPVKVLHAYLSDEDLLVLQTFPRSWYLHGTRMERAFQIGNAVPPLLAEAVGKAILRASAISEDASIEPLCA